jgi:hypothetical protein
VTSQPCLPPSTRPARPTRTRTAQEKNQLTAALAALLQKKLLPDLTSRAKEASVRAALTRRWEHEKASSRTDESFDGWVERTLEQVGAAWILSCVFVRTLEDRDLLTQRRIAGPGAKDSLQLFHKLAPRLSSRDYLLTTFREVSRLPGTEELLGPGRNPAWRLSPSVEQTDALLEFFRAPDETGAPRWSFAGEGTRFLGDLYQDISASVRERYALLQTPDFVESFILDLTLTPAIREFGLEKVRLIDPTCGSGHFLLGAFDRLFEGRLRSAPGVDKREHALAALSQVYGVDLNPYAVAIARFRLVLSFLGKAGITKLAKAPRLKLNLVVADSLLHGAKNTNQLLSDIAADRKDWGDSLFDLEDQRTGRAILSQGYHAVVGNPPYITCKDAALRGAYRALYPNSASGKFALAAPFTERFFQLALPAEEGAGFVGLINSNSFLKREFGKGLIEKVLRHLDLARVMDTSGAFIPGHGTPTVLLFGRNRRPTGEAVRAVLGKRGEPSTPQHPENGLVWRALAAHWDESGFENEYLSVANVERVTFDKHPWSLGGGGAAELKELLEERARAKLAATVASIGISSFTLEDDVFIRPGGSWSRAGAPATVLRGMVIGEAIRDWSIGELEAAFFPYTLKLPRFSGQLDYAARAVTRARNSYSIGLR